MRTLKLGECLIALAISTGLAGIATCVNADNTPARVEWVRSCTMSAKGVEETYACGKDFKQSYTSNSGWTSVLLAGRPLPVVCTATRKPWPQNDLKLDCKF